MDNPIVLMACCLALTLAVEVAGAALIFGVRSREALVIVALAQVATNPLAEAGTIGAYTFLINPIPAIAVLEVAAFVAEALIYRAKGVSEHPWAMSAALNALSFAIGVILFW